MRFFSILAMVMLLNTGFSLERLEHENIDNWAIVGWSDNGQSLAFTSSVTGQTFLLRRSIDEDDSTLWFDIFEKGQLENLTPEKADIPQRCFLQGMKLWSIDSISLTLPIPDSVDEVRYNHSKHSSSLEISENKIISCIEKGEEMNEVNREFSIFTPNNASEYVYYYYKILPDITVERDKERNIKLSDLSATDVTNFSLLEPPKSVVIDDATAEHFEGELISYKASDSSAIIYYDDMVFQIIELDTSVWVIGLYQDKVFLVGEYNQEKLITQYSYDDKFIQLSYNMEKYSCNTIYKMQDYVNLELNPLLTPALKVTRAIYEIAEN